MLSSLVLSISPITTQSFVGGISPIFISSKPDAMIRLYSLTDTFSLPSRCTILSNSSIIFLYICLYSSPWLFASKVICSSQCILTRNLYSAVVISLTLPSASFSSLSSSVKGSITLSLNSLSIFKSVVMPLLLNFLHHCVLHCFLPFMPTARQ